MRNLKLSLYSIPAGVASSLLAAQFASALKVHVAPTVIVCAGAFIVAASTYWLTLHALAQHEQIVRHIWAFLAAMLLGGMGIGVFGSLVARAQGNPPALMVIGIADFGRSTPGGSVHSWSDGASAAEFLSAEVASRLRADPRLQGVQLVRLRSPIHGATEEARAQFAQSEAIARHLNILVYGTLEGEGADSTFAPEFYVADIRGAEELLGANRLGTRIRVDAGAGRVPLVAALQKRSLVLVAVVTALGYAKAGLQGEAMLSLSGALEAAEADASPGRDTLYLLLGTANMQWLRIPDTNAAIRAYDNAIRVNPDYARAYIGIGAAYYESFRHSGTYTDLDILDRAAEVLLKARLAAEKPPAANVDAKIDTNLGNVYLALAQRGREDRYLASEQLFLHIAARYEMGEKSLQDLAANAYLGLGVVYERYDRLQAQAMYRRGASLAPRKSELGNILEEQVRRLS